ncbi:metallophosphoesterase [Staphylothermus hellenicus]|uniref:Phosphoesterase n=1 Tax=Staphylothermus hellenicus (strain DSM 12710 / JCM 10830 / BK20S6-10-b1 / P8) TaxID=591019 RepID=D7DBC8_STAHD|nr:metallophosphoesterase [Staphylothermus hellenicus]ADI31475.1 phosphodiesterase, MJ0936 family [Staphylothermus hellenicus DSM 12710]
MLIGVMSDSHDNIYAVDKALNKFIEHRVEAIIHLGDIISPFIVRRMKNILKDIKVYGVLGNNDGDIYLLNKLFTANNWELYSGPSIINLGNRNFVIMHGYDGIEHTEKLAKTLLSIEGVDAVLFGHTHRVLVQYINNKLLLNPGETCGYLTGKSTIALLDTKDLSVEVLEI